MSEETFLAAEGVGGQRRHGVMTRTALAALMLGGTFASHLGTAYAAAAADERPAKVPMPDESGQRTVQDIVAPQPPLVTATASSMATSAEPGRDMVADPVADQPGDPNALYGPPAPKVVKGELAQIDWNKAPENVPPALEEAVNLVTAKYPLALSARSGLRAAASDVKAAKWLRFPSLQADVAYRASDGSPSPQLLVEAPLWTGGRISSQIRRAKAQEDASSSQYIETVLDLALRTSNTYFEIVRQTQSEQLLAESLDVHRQLVQTMERRVNQEVSPVADLELARSRASQIEQQYTTTKQARATALRILAELVADPDYDLGPVPFYDPEIDLPSRAFLEEQAVAYDPTIRRLRAEVDVAQAEVDQTKSSILPQVNAQYSYDDIFGSRVGVVVRAQSTGGLSQFSQVNSARLRVQSALEQIRSTEQELRRDIATDIITYESAKVRASISAEATDTAARVSASYMRQFIAGRRSWLDVMNALREAVTAQIGRADAEVQVMSAVTRLLLRSGRWHPYFDADVPGPEAERKNTDENIAMRPGGGR